MTYLTELTLSTNNHVRTTSLSLERERSIYKFIYLRKSAKAKNMKMKTINAAAQLLLIRLLLMCMPENIINQTVPCSHPAQSEQPADGYMKISFDQSGPVQLPWSSSSQEECSEVTVRFAERGISTHLQSLPYLHSFPYLHCR